MPVTVGNPPAIRTPGKGPNGFFPVDMRIFRWLGSPWTPPNPSTATAIRYVRKSGSDSNGGTSPSDAWLTINKAVTTASPGTAIYVGAGTYREFATVTVTPTPTSPLWVIGDVDGAKTGDVGPVIHTQFLTNDRTIPNAGACFSTGGKANVHVSNIVFVGGSPNNQTAACFEITGVTGPTNASVTDCAFLRAGSGSGNSQTNVRVAVSNAVCNVIFNRCLFVGKTQAAQGAALAFTMSRNGLQPSDWDANCHVLNCTFITSGLGLRTISGGSAGGLGGGVYVRHSSFYMCSAGVATQDANLSSKIPVVVANCSFHANSTALSATTTGQIVEQNNYIDAQTTRTNVNAGPGSIVDGSYAALYHCGQERVWGGRLRLFGEPTDGSPLSAFASEAAAMIYRDGADRPRTATAAAGPLERGNVAVKETSSPISGLTADSFTGFGVQDYELPVDATATTVTVQVNKGSGYVGPQPDLRLLPNGEIGVGEITDSFKSPSTGGTETLTVAFTPSAVGVVTLRIAAYDTSGAAKTVFDNWEIT